MRKTMQHHICALATLAACATGPALALDAVLVGSGFTNPLFLTAPSGDPRLFIVEQAGRIKILQGGVTTTYLDISDRVANEPLTERGLLGLAFDPGFASNGRFYVDYIDNTAQRNTIVSAFTAPSAASNTANPASEQLIISVAQPAPTNHKAGWIGFRGTDPGRLYIATGDGGGSNDPQGLAQDLSSNLGKILRITPLAGGGYSIPANNPFVGQAGNDEIWAYGLRNPFRNSFDRLSGDFWIGDVGQDRREEIDFEPNGSLGGVNYGWRALEGSADNPDVPDAAPGNATPPIFDYAHGALGESVIGGYVYRGSGEPGLDGSYFFGDFVSDKIFTLDGGVASGFKDRTADLGTPFGSGAFGLSSFGEDGAGNLYAVGRNGEIYRIAAAVPEPGVWAMMLAGLLAVSGWARRRAAHAR